MEYKLIKENIIYTQKKLTWKREGGTIAIFNNYLSEVVDNAIFTTVYLPFCQHR